MHPLEASAQSQPVTLESHTGKVSIDGKNLTDSQKKKITATERSCSFHVIKCHPSVRLMLGGEALGRCSGPGVGSLSNRLVLLLKAS